MMHLKRIAGTLAEEQAQLDLREAKHKAGAESNKDRQDKCSMRQVSLWTIKALCLLHNLSLEPSNSYTTISLYVRPAVEYLHRTAIAVASPSE